MSLNFEISPEDHGQRLDRVLTAAADDMSRARVQALIKQGQVTIDGEIVVDPGAKLRTGQALAMIIPPAQEAEPKGEALPLDIVFEDGHVLVLNKPAGLVVHPGAGRQDGTLVNALIAHCGDSLSGIGGVKRPGIVHRLDRLTSGLMVVAKTDRAHRSLSEQFAAHGRDGRLHRQYRGFAWNRFVRPTLFADGRIGRHPTSRRKMAIVPEPHGREAVTHAMRAAEYAPPDRDADRSAAPHEAVPGLIVTEFTAVLETGRTHQIRVHLTALGHPLLGDPVYGRGFASRETQLPPGVRAALELLDRQALHAEVLAFEHPQTRKACEFEVELPDDLARLQKALSDWS